MPAVIVSRSWIVISRLAVTSLTSPQSLSWATFMSANSGMNLEIGSASEISPRSHSCITATALGTFDIDASRKTLSVLIGMPSAAFPKALK